MKQYINRCVWLLVAAALACAAQAQNFEKYFSDSTLRIDYTLTGNAREQAVALDAMSRMPGWYGKLCTWPKCLCEVLPR